MPWLPPAVVLAASTIPAALGRCNFLAANPTDLVEVERKRGNCMV
jgi:hypothetical protein